MTIWALLQVLFNLICLGAGLTFWLRLRRPPQDDPRLSRGLQLLQTKITVLEDLSDRTDAQVKQLTALLDQKTRMLQNKVLEAEQQILKIDHSMSRSLEVAEIFQDKIPHQEIVDRQQKVEYVRAARMAHSGLSVDEIAAQVALPREQIDLIAKFNREQLMFDEDRLPEWASRGLDKDQGAGSFALGEIDFLGGLDKSMPDLSQMAKIDRDFRQAVQTSKQQDTQSNQTLMDSKMAEQLRASAARGMQSMQPAVNTVRATAQTLKDKLVATAEDLLRTQQLQIFQQQPERGPDREPAPTPTPVAQGAHPVTNGHGFPIPPVESSEPMRAHELRQALTSQPTVKKVDVGAVRLNLAGAHAPQDPMLVRKVVFPRIEK